MPDPVAHFITFTCYGTWLHGDERGSVDMMHNRFGEEFLPEDVVRNAEAHSSMSDPPYLLDEQRRAIVLKAIIDECRRKNWTLHAVHVRSNHIHVVVTAPQDIERIMNDLKAAASRKLNKAFPDERDRKRWTRHGSTRYIWNDEKLIEKVEYVLNGQGKPMARYPDGDAK